jgi:hypothetical protein
VTGESLHVDGAQTAAIDVTIQRNRHSHGTEANLSLSKSVAKVADLVRHTEGPLSIVGGWVKVRNGDVVGECR